MNVIKQYLKGQRSRLTIDFRNKEIRLKLSQTDMNAYDELFEFAILLGNYCDKNYNKDFTLRGKLILNHKLIVCKIYTRQDKFCYSLYKFRNSNKIKKKIEFYLRKIKF